MGIMEFLNTALRMFGLWHREEFYRLRNSLIVAIAVAAIFIIPGAFLGAISWTLKVVWIEIGMLIITITSLSLAFYRIPIGIELNAFIKKAEGSKCKPAITDGAETYIRIVAGFLASELAVSLIALWLPAHKNPAMAFMALLVPMVLITYTI